MEYQDELKPFSAVITAAGQASNDLALRLGSYEKCAAKLGDKPICLASVQAALMAGASGLAVVCGPETRRALGPLPDRCIFAEPGEGPVESALNGRQALVAENTIVFLAGDLPFIEPDHVAGFVERCPTGQIWVAAGVCSDSDVVGRFPDIPGMKYSKLSGTKYAGGGIFAASQPGFEKVADLASKFSRDRKSQFRMACQFGIFNMLRFLTGTMPLNAAEVAATRLFGCESRIVTGCAPELIADVDTVDDWEFTLSVHGRQIS